LSADGIPSTALDAYQRAAAREAKLDPTCGIPWTLVAAIGRVESDHGRFGGAILRVDGTSVPKIVGIALDGTRSELIRDTDHGVLDGDPVYDRAIGPMQFLPSTWLRYGVDGNGDGIADPFNIYDAAAATAHYLCVAGGDLHTPAAMARAVFSYNHLDAYVTEVMALQVLYAGTPPLIVAPVPVPTTSSVAPKPSHPSTPTCPAVTATTTSTSPATASATSGSASQTTTSSSSTATATASSTATASPTSSPTPTPTC
jgi:membrane-bound lytic murein transglycosylase B